MGFTDKEFPFINILIKSDASGIWMNLYHKPTDTQRCLPYSTSHPKHFLKNIPFVMARRILTIAVNNAVKSKHLRQLKENSRTYGYPEKIVEIGIQKALKIPQPTPQHQPKTIEKQFSLYLYFQPKQHKNS